MGSEENLLIQSEFIKVEISRTGAELKSLLDLETNVEYLWQGNKAVFPWTSMVSFPIVGKLRDDQYRLGRKFYHLNKDGFAKDLAFDVKLHRKDQLSLVLSHDKDTLTCFPFMFNFVVTYKVYGPKLSVTYEIKNLDKKEMFFSCGISPTFKMPLTNEAVEDCLLEFEYEEERGAYYLDNDLINFHHVDNKKVFEGKKVAFSNELFSEGEMVFKDILSSAVMFRNNVNEKSVVIDFGNVPYLMLWSFPNAPFFRVTPAFGVTDAVDTDNDFYTKEGLIDLEQEKTFKYEMTFHIR